MKIYSNPNFPRGRTGIAVPQELSARRERVDTLAFVSELQERNALALEQLRARGLRENQSGRPKAAPAARSARGNHAHQSPPQSRTRQSGPHSHRISGLTGPPIEVPGGHVHTISGTTELGRRNSG
ncbi:MAG: YmaF family protein [Oscillospiraceae bacterium]|nr:YmaF family protein [Oscillospiraceae bacterium]